MYQSKPAPDESVNSFLFRILKINGFSDFIGVVHDGGWRKHPFILSKYSHVLSDVDISTLIECYDNNQRLSCIFDYRRYKLVSQYQGSSAPYNLSQTFLGNKIDKPLCKKTIEIKFCIHCINYQILQLGFTYFRSEWMYKNQCSIHRCNLSVLNDHDKKQTVKYLSEFYSGVFDEKYIRIVNDVKNYQYRNIKSYLKIAPCVELLILVFALKNKFIEPEWEYVYGYEYLTIEDLDFYRKTELVQMHKVRFLFDELMNEKFDKIITWLDELTVINPVLYRINNRTFERLLLKKSKKDCSDCHWSDCPSNTNPKDNVSNEKTLCIVCYQHPFFKKDLHNIDLFKLCYECQSRLRYIQSKFNSLRRVNSVIRRVQAQKPKMARFII